MVLGGINSPDAGSGAEVEDALRVRVYGREVQLAFVAETVYVVDDVESAAGLGVARQTGVGGKPVLFFLFFRQLLVTLAEEEEGGSTSSLGSMYFLYLRIRTSFCMGVGGGGFTHPALYAW